MKKKFILFFALLNLCGKLHYGFAQQPGFAFLESSMSARASGMAESFVAIPGDINAIPYNPATLAHMERAQASFSYFKHLLDINAGFAGYSRRFEKFGVLGAYIALMDYGTMDRRDADGNGDGTFGANDFVFTFNYAKGFQERIHAGVNAKYIGSSIDNYYSDAFALDFGIIYEAPIEGLNIGVALLNWGKVNNAFIEKKDELPLSLQVGFSKKLAHMPLLLNGKLVDINRDADKPSELLERFSIGGEFTITDFLFLRWGYNHYLRGNQDIETNAGLSGASIGSGLRWGNNAFDYSFSSWGEIGFLHRLSLSKNF